MEALTKFIFINQESLAGRILSLIIAGFTGFVVAFLLFTVVRFVLKKSFKVPPGLFNNKLRTIVYLFFIVLSIVVTLPALKFNEVIDLYLKKIFNILFIATFTVLLIQIAKFFRSLFYLRHDISMENNLSSRKIRTQLDFLYKLAIVVITLIGVSVILMSFEPVKQLGTSILASAGIAGIIVGFAAQKSISNLLAGFQIAFTQPIRIDDVVIVEGEWGRIEEISLTYVVLRIWDQRRLIIPISYFLEKPFQNWTRVSAELLGTVFLYVDYSLPVDVLRDELTKILNSTPLWDKRVNGIQVTDTTERSVQIRILVSARNSSAAWDLRCLVREKLIQFIQNEYPGCLPKIRADKLESL